jgi:hypothetical protein
MSFILGLDGDDDSNAGASVLEAQPVMLPKASTRWHGAGVAMKGLQRLGSHVAGGGMRASHHLAFQAWLALVHEVVVELLLLEVKAFD